MSKWKEVESKGFCADFAYIADEDDGGRTLSVLRMNCSLGVEVDRIDDCKIAIKFRGAIEKGDFVNFCRDVVDAYDQPFDKEISHLLDIIQQKLDNSPNYYQWKILKRMKGLFEKYIPE